MNLKFSWCSGLALRVVLVSVALAACSSSTKTSTSSTAIALLRYTANGTPDTSLAGGGLVTTDLNPSQNDLGFAVLLQPADGKIIAVGNTLTTQGSVVVIRYAADGTLDTTFGNGGITITSLPSADAGAFAAVLQPDGKILVAGRSTASSGSTSFLLLRYTVSGALDTGFGAGQGFVTTAIPLGTDTAATSIALSGSDIVVAGHSSIGGKFAIVLAGYTTTGALDPAFSGGIVATPVGAVDADVAALAVQADGKIIAAGSAGDFASSIWDVALLRYNANGTLDLPFGGNNTGMVITDIGSSSNYANAVAIQPDQRIVVAGNALDLSGSASDIAVLRYTTSGVLDTTTFGGGNGFVTTNVSGFDNAFAVAVQPLDGKIVVAGSADADTASRLTLLRYGADGTLDIVFGNGGIVTRAATGPTFISAAKAVVLQQPGGEIVLVGYD